MFDTKYKKQNKKMFWTYQKSVRYISANEQNAFEISRSVIFSMSSFSQGLSVSS